MRGGGGGDAAPQIFARLFFLWIEKNSAKVKNSTKLQKQLKLEMWNDKNEAKCGRFSEEYPTCGKILQDNLNTANIS